MAVLPLIANTSIHVCPFVLNSVSGKLCVFNAAQVYMDWRELGWRIGGVSSLKPAGVQARGGRRVRPAGGAHLQEGLTSRTDSPPGGLTFRGLSSRRDSPPGGVHLQDRLTSRRDSPPVHFPLGCALPRLPALRGISVRAAHLPVRL